MEVYKKDGYIDINCYLIKCDLVLCVFYFWYSGKNNDINFYIILKKVKVVGKCFKGFIVNYVMEFEKWDFGFFFIV